MTITTIFYSLHLRLLSFTNSDFSNLCFSDGNISHCTVLLDILTPPPSTSDPSPLLNKLMHHHSWAGAWIKYGLDLNSSPGMQSTVCRREYGTSMPQRCNIQLHTLLWHRAQALVAGSNARLHCTSTMQHVNISNSTRCQYDFLDYFKSLKIIDQ